MINKIKDYVIGSLILLLIGNFVYNDIRDSQREEELLNLRNEKAKLSSIVKEDSSTFSRLIQEVGKEKDINKFLSSENSKLADKIKHIQSVVVVTVKPESVRITSKDLAVGDSISQVVDTTKTPERINVKFSLGTKNPMYSAKGFTWTNPPEAEVSILQKPFKIFYVLNQNEDETWKATIDFRTLTNEPLPYNVIGIDGRVNPKPIKQESVYNLGLGVIASTDKLAPGILIKADKNLFLFSYRLIDKLTLQESKTWYERIEVGWYRLLF